MFIFRSNDKVSVFSIASHKRSTVMSKTKNLKKQSLVTVLGNIGLLQYEAQLHCADLS